jgi:carbon storage regulator
MTEIQHGVLCTNEPLTKKQGMLVLSRRIGERVVIGDDIFVTIKAIVGKKVWLTLHAPTQVIILRSELLCSPMEDPASSSGNVALPIVREDKDEPRHQS